MFTTKIVSLLLLVPNNLQNFLSGDSQSIYIRFKEFKNPNAGNDQRYYIANNNNSSSSDNNDIRDNNDISDTPFMLHKIRRHIINKNIIEELENNNTNIHNKLNIIEKYTDMYENQNKISEFNLLAGNLLNDFYDVI
jgi:hypothetical protein